MKSILVMFPLLMLGCVQQHVTYTHSEAFDRMTAESRGDNISDYNMLRSKAEEMCANEGFKEGVTVLGAGPGSATYTLDYQCKGKNPGVVEQLTKMYGQAKKQFQ